MRLMIWSMDIYNHPETQMVSLDYWSCLCADICASPNWSENKLTTSLTFVNHIPQQQALCNPKICLAIEARVSILQNPNLHAPLSISGFMTIGTTQLIQKLPHYYLPSNTTTPAAIILVPKKYLLLQDISLPMNNTLASPSLSTTTMHLWSLVLSSAIYLQSTA